MGYLLGLHIAMLPEEGHETSAAPLRTPLCRSWEGCSTPLILAWLPSMLTGDYCNPECFKSASHCLREALCTHGLLSRQVDKGLKSNSLTSWNPKERSGFGQRPLAGIRAYVTLQYACKLPGESEEEQQSQPQICIPSFYLTQTC